MYIHVNLSKRTNYVLNTYDEVTEWGGWKLFAKILFLWPKWYICVFYQYNIAVLLNMVLKICLFCNKNICLLNSLHVIQHKIIYFVVCSFYNK